MYFDGIKNKALKASGTTVNFTGEISIDGTYPVTIMALDPAGNLSDVSTSLPFRLDTEAFAPQSVPDLLQEYDTGFSSSDDITKIRVPQFRIAQLPLVSDSLHLFIKSGITNLENV